MYSIYEPKGKAREYSPLALNIYNGCDHNCVYCYVKTGMSFVRCDNNDVTVKKDLIKYLEKDCKNNIINKQVLLSFTGDPYCKKDKELEITKQVLEILYKYNVPTAILSKGGFRILRDLELFKKFGNMIKVGATLTFDNNIDSIKNESGGAIPEERIETLKILYENGVKTWVSLEPVFSVEQTMNLMELTKNYVNEYKIGKLNHYKIENEPNWRDLLESSVKFCIDNNKEFYIKDDLFRFNPDIKIESKNRDKDYLCIKKEIKNSLF